MKLFLKLFCINLFLFVSIAANAEQATDSPYYRAGNFVFISGQVAIDPHTGKDVYSNRHASAGWHPEIEATTLDASFRWHDRVNFNNANYL